MEGKILSSIKENIDIAMYEATKVDIIIAINSVSSAYLWCLTKVSKYLLLAGTYFS